MTQNVVDLDAAARIYGSSEERMMMPILAFWDFGSAFPSLAHAWVFTVLAAMRLPPVPTPETALRVDFALPAGLALRPGEHVDVVIH